MGIHIEIYSFYGERGVYERTIIITVGFLRSKTK